MEVKRGEWRHVSFSYQNRPRPSSNPVYVERIVARETDVSVILTTPLLHDPSLVYRQRYMTVATESVKLHI